MLLEHLFSGAKTTEELLDRLEALEEENKEVFINDYDTIPLNKLKSIIMQSINDEYTTNQIYNSLNKFWCS